MSLFCSVLFYNSLKHAEFYFVLICNFKFSPLFPFFLLFPQAFHSIAKCVAALAMSCLSDGESVVNQFVRDIQVKMSFNVKCQIYTFVIILPLINKYYYVLIFFLSTEWKGRWSVTFVFSAVIGWNRKTHVRWRKILLCVACSTSVFGPPQRPLCLNFALRPLSRHSLLLHHQWPLAKKGKVTETPGVLKIPSSV